MIYSYLFTLTQLPNFILFDIYVTVTCLTFIITPIRCLPNPQLISALVWHSFVRAFANYNFHVSCFIYHPTHLSMLLLFFLQYTAFLQPAETSEDLANVLSSGFLFHQDSKILLAEKFINAEFLILFPKYDFVMKAELTTILQDLNKKWQTPMSYGFFNQFQDEFVQFQSRLDASEDCQWDASSWTRSLEISFRNLTVSDYFRQPGAPFAKPPRSPCCSSRLSGRYWSLRKRSLDGKLQ